MCICMYQASYRVERPSRKLGTLYEDSNLIQLTSPSRSTGMGKRNNFLCNFMSGRTAPDTTNVPPRFRPGMTAYRHRAHCHYGAVRDENAQCGATRRRMGCILIAAAIAAAVIGIHAQMRADVQKMKR